jgi:hypothetical protein
MRNLSNDNVNVITESQIKPRQYSGVEVIHLILHVFLDTRKRKKSRKKPIIDESSGFQELPVYTGKLNNNHNSSSSLAGNVFRNVCYVTIIEVSYY